MKKSIFIFVLALTACSEEVKTVEYYRTHKQERLDMLKKCETKEEPLMANSNCFNAKRAHSIEREIHGKIPTFN